MFAVLRLIWPYLLRYLMNQGAEQTANYLQARRERRTDFVQDQDDEPQPLPDEPDEAFLKTICPPPPARPFFAGDAFWFTLSGLLLGLAFSLIVSILKRDD